MGLPKIGFVRLVLMVLFAIEGPWAIHELSKGRLWLAPLLCLLLILLARYAAADRMRRLYTTLLVAIAMGTFGYLVISSGIDAWLVNRWSEREQQAARTMTVAVSYATSFAITWLGLWLVAALGVDFLVGLHPFLREKPGAVRKFLMEQFLGISQAYQIVENGKVTVTKPAGVLAGLGGRGLLVIKPTNSVITEWGGEIRRVVGPGIDWTERFEQIKQVVDLSCLRTELDVSAQTREGIPLNAKILAYFQIKPAPKTVSPVAAPQPNADQVRHGKKPADNTKAAAAKKQAHDLAQKLGLPQPAAQPINEEAILQATYCTADKDWKQCVADAISVAVVETINSKSLDQVYSLNQQERKSTAAVRTLSREARRRANGNTCTWGVTVTGLAITALEAPAEVRERTLKPIAAAGEAEAVGARGEAQVNVTQLLESTRSQVRTEEIQRMVRLLEEYREKIPEDQLLRALMISERLAGALSRQTPEDSMRLVQAAEDAIGRLTAR